MKFIIILLFLVSCGSSNSPAPDSASAPAPQHVDTIIDINYLDTNPEECYTNSNDICYIVKGGYYVGKFHRDNGPAQTNYDSDDIKENEQWYYKGELHRIGGPAFTAYDINGNITTEWYFENGVRQ